jgi:type 1 glutamine amidotransferase
MKPVHRLPLLAVAVFAIAASARAAEPQRPARLLVVTVTMGFRHDSITMSEPILEELGRSSGVFHVDFLRMPSAERPSEDDASRQKILEERFASAFSAESLASFDGVMFLNTTGSLPLPDLQAFLGWVKSGKAFVGVHAATDTFQSSDLYCDFVGGIFAGHPWNAGGEHAFVVHEPGHRLTAMFAPRFRWRDEVYQYDLRYKPENLRVLVSLDMPASTPKEPWHVPVSWVRDYGQGRVFSTNFGHNDATWKEPMFQKHMVEGIAWALGRFDAPAAPNPDVQAAEYLRSVIAAAAAAGGMDADALRAKADEKVAKDASWATGLRPMLLELRGMKPEERSAAYSKVVAEIEKP